MGASFLAGPPLLAQGGITNEGPLTVFRSGTASNLLTLALPFSIPATNAAPVLRFDFGFSTAEPEAPATFYDSFSVTLQNPDQSATALLLTADRTGTSWAPENPGGTFLAPESLSHSTNGFPPLTPDLATKMAFSVACIVPAAFASAPATLFLDFFDNLNAFASLAWIANVRLETSATPLYRLHSAPVPTGPYAEEPGAQLDLANRLFTTATPPGNRFYRIQGEKAVRITWIQPSSGAVVIRFATSLYALQAAANPAGPFVEDNRFAHDETNLRFTGPLPASPWFGRITGERDTVITAIRPTSTQLVIEYAFVRLRLLAASEVSGPYTEVSSYFVNDTTRTIVTAAQPSRRFFRISGNARVQIVDIDATPIEVQLKYILVP